MIAVASAKVDEFTKFTGRIPLRGGGSRSRPDADEKALAEWAKYKIALLEHERQLADAETPDLIEAPKGAQTRRQRTKLKPDDPS